MFKTTLSLSFIVATRFFGLFIILPVFSLYAKDLNGANDLLVGVAVGIYALSQMALQIPFGMMSDKFGRKISMLIGLVIFIIGSLICAFASEIYTMIFGRFLQGCGAVGAVAIAMISDFTTEKKRGKAMALMGSMIALSFCASMVIAPVMASKLGLASLFHLSAVLTLLCIALLFLVVPKEIKTTSYTTKTGFFRLIANKNLFIMNTTNFLQKMFMTMAFLIIPIVLVQNLWQSRDDIWQIYALAMVCGMVAMGFAGAAGETKKILKQILLAGVVLFGLSYTLFYLAGDSQKWLFLVGVVLFFVGFNMHEPVMQSVASKLCKSSQKGEVLGIFNSSGYMGSFLGGVFGGFVMHKFGVNAIFVGVVICSVFWLIMLCFLENPANLSNLYLKKELVNFESLKNLALQNGFIESYEQNGVIVVKFNSKFISTKKVKEILKVSDE